MLWGERRWSRDRERDSQYLLTRTALGSICSEVKYEGKWNSLIHTAFGYESAHFLMGYRICWDKRHKINRLLENVVTKSFPFLGLQPDDREHRERMKGMMMFILLIPSFWNTMMVIEDTSHHFGVILLDIIFWLHWIVCAHAAESSTSSSDIDALNIMAITIVLSKYLKTKTCSNNLLTLTF